MREDLKTYLQTPEHTTDDLDYAQVQRLANRAWHGSLKTVCKC